MRNSVTKVTNKLNLFKGNVRSRPKVFPTPTASCFRMKMKTGSELERVFTDFIYFLDSCLTKDVIAISFIAYMYSACLHSTY